MGRVDFAGRDVELGLDVAHLGVEDAVGIKDAFGRTGAAGGKEDGGDFVWAGICHGVGLPVSLADSIQCQATPEPAATHGDEGGDRLEILGRQGAQDMGRGDADQGLGPAFRQAVQHSADAHSRIDHHGHSPHLEQGEDQGEKVQAGLDHQDRAYAAADAHIVQPLGQTVRFDVQLAESQVAVCDSPMAVPTGRADHRPLVGLDTGHGAQVGGDIDRASIGFIRSCLHRPLLPESS